MCMVPQVNKIKTRDKEEFDICILSFDLTRKLMTFPLSVEITFFAYLAGISITWLVFTNGKNLELHLLTTCNVM